LTRRSPRPPLDSRSKEALPSLDAIHLAAAAAVADTDSVLATWDARLHTAAHRRGLEVMPARIG